MSKIRFEIVDAVPSSNFFMLLVNDDCYYLLTTEYMPVFLSVTYSLTYLTGSLKSCVLPFSHFMAKEAGT